MARNICKEIKYSEDEKKIISKCAEKRNERIGTYIREASVSGEIRVYDLNQLNHLIMSFNRIGNEINSIAEVVNSTRTITQKDIEDMKKSFEYFERVFEYYLLPLKFDFFNNE